MSDFGELLNLRVDDENEEVGERTGLWGILIARSNFRAFRRNNKTAGLPS